MGKKKKKKGGTMVLAFSPSIEGWFLMMGAEF